MRTQVHSTRATRPVSTIRYRCLARGPSRWRRTILQERPRAFQTTTGTRGVSKIMSPVPKVEYIAGNLKLATAHRVQRTEPGRFHDARSAKEARGGHVTAASIARELHGAPGRGHAVNLS